MHAVSVVFAADAVRGIVRIEDILDVIQEEPTDSHRKQGDVSLIEDASLDTESKRNSNRRDASAIGIRWVRTSRVQRDLHSVIEWFAERSEWSVASITAGGDAAGRTHTRIFPS